MNTYELIRQKNIGASPTILVKFAFLLAWYILILLEARTTRP